MESVTIPRSATSPAFAADAVPVARVPPGTVVIFETTDEPYRSLASGVPVDRSALERFNLVSGPLAVEGIEPGDVLRVDILEITIERAWLVFLRSYGPLGDLLPETLCKQLSIEAGRLVVSSRLRLPVRPSIGCLGLAPRSGRTSTFRPVRPWGGNLDLPELAPGSTVWLPVQRPEGYLYVGDVHAAMGAGEPAHVGIEAAARVRVRVDRSQGLCCPAPRIRTTGELLFVGIGETVTVAQRHALEHAVGALRNEYGLASSEAYALASACLSYRFGGPAGPVVLAAVPLDVLAQLPASATPS
ncbi:MAG: acetamidase/formamidase family protein [Thermomicrobium sp.]|nr:acetamidase/formamidase family protein [Thermomicrobium sp.]MDW8059616.1 acetamidase/formamidase family protein [Thermomicrobium sp.]